MQNKRLKLTCLALVVLNIASAALAWRYYRALTIATANAISPIQWNNLQKLAWQREKELDELRHRPAPSAQVGNEHRSSLDVLAYNIARNLVGRLTQPEVQKIQTELSREDVQRRYGKLIGRLNLSSEQRERVLELLTSKEMAAMDVLSASNQGITDPGDFHSLIQGEQNDIDRDIRQTLGDSGFAELQGFQREAAVGGVLRQLQSKLAGGSAPLSADESKAVRAVLQNDSTIPPDGNVQGLGMAPISRTAIDQLKPVLTAPQIAALQDLQRHQELVLRLQRAMASNDAGKDGSSTVAR